jgi:hypothetical protein
LVWGPGLFLGFALGAALAAAFHVSTFEGEACYFAVTIAILVTLVVTPWNALSSTRWLNKCGFTAYIPATPEEEFAPSTIPLPSSSGEADPPCLFAHDAHSLPPEPRR